MTCRSPGTKSEQSAYSQSIVRIHCKVDLWTKAEPKTSYHSQNLAHQMRHSPEWPLPTAVFSAGARRYTTTVLWPKCYLALPLRTFSTKNRSLHSLPSQLIAVTSKDIAPVLQQQFLSFRRGGRSIRQHTQRKQRKKSPARRTHWNNTLDQNSSLFSLILYPSDKMPRNPHVP